MSLGKDDNGEHRAFSNSDAKVKNLYTPATYWNQLERDLLNANRSVIVLSPYLTMNRSERYLDVFHTLKRKGRSILVITKPPESQRYQMIQQSRNVIGFLSAIDVDLCLGSDIHQKIILIDDKICWEGSINWLSHNSRTAEHIRRITDLELVAEVRESLSSYLDPYAARLFQVAECIDAEQTYFGNLEMSESTSQLGWTPKS